MLDVALVHRRDILLPRGIWHYRHARSGIDTYLLVTASGEIFVQPTSRTTRCDEDLANGLHEILESLDPVRTPEPQHVTAFSSRRRALRAKEAVVLPFVSRRPSVSA